MALHYGAQTEPQEGCRIGRKSLLKGVLIVIVLTSIPAYFGINYMIKIGSAPTSEELCARLILGTPNDVLEDIYNLTRGYGLIDLWLWTKAVASAVSSKYGVPEDRVYSTIKCICYMMKRCSNPFELSDVTQEGLVNRGFTLLTVSLMIALLGALALDGLCKYGTPSYTAQCCDPYLDE